MTQNPRARVPTLSQNDRAVRPVESQTGGGVAEVVLIVAAGRGSRMGVDAGTHTDGPKQYRDLGGKPVLSWTVAAFGQRARVREIVVVIHADDRALYEVAIGHVSRQVPLAEPVIGGATRQASVFQGLLALAERWPPSTRVLIHDAVRPFVSQNVMAAAVAALEQAVEPIADLGAMPGRAVVDTLIRVSSQNVMGEGVGRDGLIAVETPQVFPLGAIVAAHRRANAESLSATDDAALFQAAGGVVHVTAGAVENFKITTTEDLDRARALVANQQVPDVRTGQGFDVHTFGPGDHVWLGGVRIQHSHGVVAHSDGDVVLHALTDALLGTIADKDIGYHFQNTDPRWRGAASAQFLEDAVARVRAANGVITLLDATVLCEAPKVGPHRDAMCRAIAQMAAIDVGRVSIKATTTEQLGAFGRREGLAALATATVVFRGV